VAETERHEILSFAGVILQHRPNTEFSNDLRGLRGRDKRHLYLPRDGVCAYNRSHYQTRTKDKAQQMTSQVNDERVPARAAHTLNQLEAMGLGSRAFLYNQIGAGLLRAIKLGGKTIVLEEDRLKWLASQPEAKITPPAPSKKQREVQKARAPAAARAA
jgi:hypothetical protein